MQLKNKTTEEVFEVTGQVNCLSQEAIATDEEILVDTIYVNYSFVDMEGVVATTSIKEGETENNTFVII